MTPEEKARVGIDALLHQAGWHVCDMAQANIHAARGVALREFPLKTGFGFADYLLYIDGKAAGVIDAKKEGATLVGVKRLPVPLPPIAEQIRIVAEVERRLSLIGQAETQAELNMLRAQRLRSSFLRNAFTTTIKYT